MRPIPCIALLGILFKVAYSWQLWTDDSTPTSPGPRAGHTLMLWNQSIYLFGGRGNEISTIHDPKTYQIGKINGTLFFETYDQKHFKECFDDAGIGNNDPASNLTAAQYAACYDIRVGTYFNDVWSYDLNCTRYGDGPCEGTGWSRLSSNAVLGGCKIYNESEVCTHPHERWEHASAILTQANSTVPGQGNNSEAWLLVYGGFARMCEDYCSDMWALPVASCQRNASLCEWSRIATLGRDGPGKRWRAASTGDDQRWVMFGGHRLWQGFAQANSVYNDWNDTTRFEHGGYLDDLWMYSLHPGGPQALLYNDTNQGIGTTSAFGRQPLDTSYGRDLVFGQPVQTQLGAWQQILPRESCFKYPGIDWSERNDILCSVVWPSPRASAAIVMTGEHLYLHGGYSAPFPYPHVLGRGAGPGTGSLQSDSKAPYPSYPYYLDDMWRFDLISATWTLLQPTANPAFPAARRGHSLVVAGAALLMTGGYSQNVFSQDLWIYNLTNDHWLLKDYFPWPLFPTNCTSDVSYNPATDLEDLIINPATGQSMMSVWGEPTRGTLLDGLFGRAGYDVFVRQTRRQAPGWDGCRDRYDARPDLPPQLQYRRPSHRSSHAAVYSNDWNMMLLYGGEALFREELPLLSITYQSEAVGDLWVWGRDSCPRNCSGHGDCWYGHCYCQDGYYGIDCSNATCPGDYCFYNTLDHYQVCQHCCSAPYNHTDGDTYIENQRKVPCDDSHHGLSHGICDGFGYCQCAPPFLTEDCSVKDCANNCSGNGWCSVEYPVSRCMCNPPFTGNDCSAMMCLNNCSYPNGECQPDGTCACTTVWSPYNRTVAFSTYYGDDCSWLVPFAGAEASSGLSLAAIAGIVVAVLVSSLMAMTGVLQWARDG